MANNDRQIPGFFLSPYDRLPPSNETPEQSRIRTLESDLKFMKDACDRQDAYMKKLAKAAHAIATVVDIRGDRMTIAHGSLIDTTLLEGAKIGDVVCCMADTMQPISVLKDVQPTGTIATIRAVRSDGQVEIENSGVGEGRVLRAVIPVSEGDRVVIDMSMSVVIQNLGRPKSQLAWEQPTNTTWDDVGGHEEAKRALRDAIETPVLHPELFAAYGRRHPRGVLLYGPPGTGKTLLAKASATALARVHGRDTAAGFIYVKGPALLSKWVGESESSVRAIFSAAREHKRTHGYPALVFIDEAEAILGKRGDNHRGILTQTMVPQFLAEMDGLEESGAIVLLATNRANDLDPAITRDGRIDRKIKVGRPEQADTARIAAIHLRNRPIQGDAAELAKLTAEVVHTEPVGVAIGPGGEVPIMLAAFSSGAMIAGIIENAAAEALDRDVAAGKISGIAPDDIRAGVQKVMAGLAGLNHDDVFADIFAAHPNILVGDGPAKVNLHDPNPKMSN